MICVGDPSNDKTMDLVLDKKIPIWKGARRYANSSYCKGIVRKLLSNHIRRSEDPGCFPGRRVLVCSTSTNEEHHAQKYAFDIEGLYLSTSKDADYMMRRCGDVRITFGMYSNDKDLNNPTSTGTFLHSNDPCLHISHYYIEDNYTCTGPLKDMLSCVLGSNKCAMTMSLDNGPHVQQYQSWMQNFKCCITIGRSADPENPFAVIIMNALPRLWESKLSTIAFLTRQDVEETRFMAQLLTVRDYSHWLQISGNKEKAGETVASLVQRLPESHVNQVCKKIMIMALTGDSVALMRTMAREALYTEKFIKPLTIPSNVHYTTLPAALRYGNYPYMCRLFVTAIFESRLGQEIPVEILVYIVLGQCKALEQFAI